MKKIYVLGNPILEEDSLTLKIAKVLRCKYEIEEFDPLEDIKEETCILIDVSPDVEKVVVTQDIEILQTRKIYTLHDFDLALLLKLKKEIGQLKKITLIILPQKGNIDQIAIEVEEILNKLLREK